MHTRTHVHTNMTKLFTTVRYILMLLIIHCSLYTLSYNTVRYRMIPNNTVLYHGLTGSSSRLHALLHEGIRECNQEKIQGKNMLY